MKDFLKALRDDHSDFDQGKLESHFGSSPFEMFDVWYKAAFEKESEPNAMTVSTVSEGGQPTARILYLKECSNEKFVFFTNYESEKGKSLAFNPKVCLTFFWPGLQRQVRIDGIARKADGSVSDTYFASRPRGSQLGAWASEQSDVLEERSVLEERLISFDNKFEGEVPRPPHWGGYEVEATRIEFWQGRPSRLHDRIVFEKNSDNWSVFRVNP